MRSLLIFKLNYLKLGFYRQFKGGITMFYNNIQIADIHYMYSNGMVKTEGMYILIDTNGNEHIIDENQAELLITAAVF